MIHLHDFVTLILQAFFRIFPVQFSATLTFHRLIQLLALSGVLGYLIGSIPTAFLLVRWKSNVDIRQEGSGNVGALNSLLVTGSKVVGAVVLLLDLMKGVLAVLLARSLFAGFASEAIAGSAAVLGHNYSIWLRFKGGRGLATAAGVMLVLSWPVVAVWGCLWGSGFGLTRNVNIGSAIASVGGLVGVLLLPEEFVKWFAGNLVLPLEFRVFAVVLFVLILVKLVDPVRQFFASPGRSRQ
jgi:acyl phosphate:glycerol-3-phosphate acyltransferase